MGRMTKNLLYRSTSARFEAKGKKRKNLISVGKLVKKIKSSENVKVVEDFDNMGLKENLLRGVYAFGFEKPSAIQQRAVIPIINGRDVIAQAQSGTGKSSMIAIASCQIINIRLNSIQVLVLSPTRELAQQTEKVVLARRLYEYQSSRMHR